MVNVTVLGKEFNITSFHDVEVMSYFPEGEPNVNGLVQCLSDAFNNKEVDMLLERMTVKELLALWEQWSEASNFEFVYNRVYDVLHDEHKKKVGIGFWLLGSWLLTGIIAIVAIVLLVV